MTETEIADLVATPEVQWRLGLELKPPVHAVALSARGTTYKVSSAEGLFIVRLPRDAAHLAALRREARIAAELRGQISMRVPDTQVFAELPDRPAFALHRLIPGEPLTTDHYTQSSPAARERLVADLASFFHEMHRVPLERAAGWLDVRCKTADVAAELAPILGKPAWFGSHAVAEIRARLAPILEAETRRTFEQTMRLFRALEARPEYMVFGHGDMHGYNVAIAQDDLGPRLVGVFDMECSGILDVHEDFFRLSLVSEPMLEQVLLAYQRLPGPRRAVVRARIAIYYRAFLFYLMVGKSGPRLAHLHRLLHDHLAYCSTHHGNLDKV
jgi:aminoglycoside phosphotransferase (APT) family kinase protein